MVVSICHFFRNLTAIAGGDPVVKGLFSITLLEKSWTTCSKLWLLYYSSFPLVSLLGLLRLKVHKHLENYSVEGSLFSPLHPLLKLLISIKNVGIFSVCFNLTCSLFDFFFANCWFCLYTPHKIFYFHFFNNSYLQVFLICSLFHFIVPQISFSQTFIKTASHISVALCNIILFTLFQAASLSSFSTFIFHPIYLEINLLSNISHSCVFYSCSCYTFILLFSVISSFSKSI